MPRRPRLFVPGGFYHVTARGNHRQPIFRRPSDRRRLDEIVAEAIEPARARIHAYCWMTNHLHLLVQVSDRPLSVLMQRICTRFARVVQKSVPTTGHLFENRYHAPLVDVDAYFLELLRYIHLNPVRAGLVRRPEQHRWSGHRVYLGLSQQPWLTTDFGLSLFHADLGQARTRYAAFVAERLGAPSDPALYRGHPRESRVLGGDAFLAGLQAARSCERATITLEQLAVQVCLEAGVSLEELRSGSRARSVSKVRSIIAARAQDDQVATLSDVARMFGRSVASVSRAAARCRRPGAVRPGSSDVQICKPDSG